MFECNTDYYYEEPDYDKLDADRQYQSDWNDYIADRKCDEYYGSWQNT